MKKKNILIIFYLFLVYVLKMVSLKLTANVFFFNYFIFIVNI